MSWTIYHRKWISWITQKKSEHKGNGVKRRGERGGTRVDEGDEDGGLLSCAVVRQRIQGRRSKVHSYKQKKMTASDTNEKDQALRRKGTTTEETQVERGECREARVGNLPRRRRCRSVDRWNDRHLKTNINIRGENSGGGEAHWIDDGVPAVASHLRKILVRKGPCRERR